MQDLGFSKGSILKKAYFSKIMQRIALFYKRLGGGWD